MNKRPGHVTVTTDVGFCSFCGRPRNLRNEAHQLGTMVRTIVTCETCHRTLSSTMGVASDEPEPVPAVPEAEVAEPEPAPAKPAAKRTVQRKPAATAARTPAAKPPAAKSPTSKTRAKPKSK